MTTDNEVEALVADRYLDALLAAVDRHADDTPADAALDPALREAARVLRRSLVRVHPSFRFEERLAARLADLAATQAAPAIVAGRGGGTVVNLHPAAALEADPLLQAILRGEIDPADADAIDHAAGSFAARRPLLVGGAITSAAISIVGVAYVAWRASHPAGRTRSGHAMARAARAAHAKRGIATASALMLATATGAATLAGGLGAAGTA